MIRPPSRRVVIGCRTRRHCPRPAPRVMRSCAPHSDRERQELQECNEKRTAKSDDRRTDSGGKRQRKRSRRPSGPAKIKSAASAREPSPGALHHVAHRRTGPLSGHARRTDDVRARWSWHRTAGCPGWCWGGLQVTREDGGFPGVVFALDHRGKADRFEMKGATAIVGAGMPTPLLARRTADAGFAGVERFLGIPGSVGGGIYMNRLTRRRIRGSRNRSHGHGSPRQG